MKKEIEIKLTLEVDCDNGAEGKVKETIIEWMMHNLPMLWEEDDAVIRSIKREFN